MKSVQAWQATLAVAVLLTGCASAPQNAAHTDQPALAAPESATAASGSGPAASAVATSGPAGAVASADGAPDSLSVVDLNKRPLDEAENSGQICRQMLKPNTNSILTVCGTAAEWKKFRAAEAAQAEDNLLRWQAGRF